MLPSSPSIHSSSRSSSPRAKQSPRSKPPFVSSSPCLNFLASIQNDSLCSQSSSKKQRPSIYSDRHIPNRSSLNLQAAFSLAPTSNSIFGPKARSNNPLNPDAPTLTNPFTQLTPLGDIPPFNPEGSSPHQHPSAFWNTAAPPNTDPMISSPSSVSSHSHDPNHLHQQLALADETYNSLLKNELFGLSIPKPIHSKSSSVSSLDQLSVSSSSSSVNNPAAIATPRKQITHSAPQNSNIFQYKTPKPKKNHISFNSINKSTLDLESLDDLFDPYLNSLDPSNPSRSSLSLSINDNSVDPLSSPPSTPNRNTQSISQNTPSSLSSFASFQENSPSVSRTRRNLLQFPITKPDPTDAAYASPFVSLDSQRLLLKKNVISRLIPRTPYSVLDAPDLADDFYLNLIDWGSQNFLAVALGSKVYIWDAVTTNVNCLCDLNTDPVPNSASSNSTVYSDDMVTSVSWIKRGSHLAIGTRSGLIQIWDVNRGRRVRCMTGHTKRVGALSWNDHILTSGSRDRSIIHRDVRIADHYTCKLEGAHKQEVCGLQWNYEASGGRGLLASGGNDNKLAIWDSAMTGSAGVSANGVHSANTTSSYSSSPGTDSGSNWKPLYRFTDHKAAVKALAWSPHTRNLLASGGGTADRRIRFWDTAQGNCIQELDTGSQVCSLEWSQFGPELVSSHGYSQNAIVVWKYPSMKQTSVLTGHTSRVLYMTMSPDGKSIATGAGDETLRFWNLWGDAQDDNSWFKNDSVLDVFPKLR